MTLYGQNGTILPLWNSFLKNQFFLKMQWVHVSGGLLISFNMSAVIVNGLVLKKQKKGANYLLVIGVETLCSLFCLLELRKMFLDET